jgi:hypothetical protein
MYHIAFYVPETHVEIVKESLFGAGAGTIGNYERCSFEYRGLGQFKPLPGAKPFIGSEGQLEVVPELKVELVCKNEFLKAAIVALHSSHPYETPAYYVTEIVGI